MHSLTLKHLKVLNLDLKSLKATLRLKALYFAATLLKIHDIVSTLITHTPQWTGQAMGFKGLWVAEGGKKISTHKSHGNLRKSYFLCYKKSTQLEENNQCHLSKSLLMYFFSAVLAS